MSRRGETGGEQPTLSAWQPDEAPDEAQDAPDPDARTAPQSALYSRAGSGGTISHGEEPAATPEKPHDECQNCGRHVTARMRRLFGDNADVMWHCPDCLEDNGALGFGAGAKPDFDGSRTIASQTMEERS